MSEKPALKHQQTKHQNNSFLMKFPTRKIRFFLITACLLMGSLYVLQEAVRFGIAWCNSPTLLPYYPDASKIEFHLQPTLQYLSKFNPDLTGTLDYSPQSILARLKDSAAGKEVQKESAVGNREFEVMIVTSETLRDKEMRALPLQNRQAYAEKHRYSTYFNFHNYHPQYLRCLAWNKVLLLFQLVARFQTFSQSPQSPQWIWMLDYDILIMNQTLSLQDRILSHVQELRRERGQSMETCHLIISQDCLGINTGSMLVRVNSPWVLDFLRLW